MLRLSGLLLCLLPSLFLLLFLQRLNDAVDGFIALGLIHAGEFLQGVLQMYRLGIGHQFIEHLRAVGELLIVGALLVEHTDGLTITALGIGIALKVPIQVAKLKQQHTFLGARPSALLIALLITGNGLRRILLGEIDVTDGIIHLIKIIFIIIRPRHALQPANHLTRLTLSQHLRLGDAGVEFQFIRRIEPHRMTESLISLLIAPQSLTQLPHEEPLTGFLLAPHLMADDLTQVGNGTGIVAAMKVIVGHGIVPLLLRPPWNGVAPHIAYHIFGVVKKAVLDITLGQPRPGEGID